ncbi:Acetone carboxylase gamma subunit [wastewater metagenome]|uniref:Acetone carboxylase gamma subunit n=2 Tax=unclassified sequences TaxID=12908 RepID=A0A5B8RHM2_9ZZZZ|nr:acetone carboxylase subunit gamma [Arhodomonas sp. KWT]QEA06435.1 acetone carboxylase gamma subunit [uncultured organism]
MSSYTKKDVQELVDGTLGWETTHRMLSMPKDAQRFVLYREVLQEKVDWDDPILLPLGPHLYVVVNADGDWVTQCSCGHEFCDYRQNWKLEALVHVRDSKEELNELYPELMSPDPEWQVYREYYCPKCGVQHDVEAPTPWYPVIHDFEPDIETFYRDWLEIPLPQRGQ